LLEKKKKKKKKGKIILSITLSKLNTMSNSQTLLLFYF